MNLLKDIKEIVKNDREHNVEVQVDGFGIRVFLEYDPESTFERKMIIPIEYAALEEFAYIPDTNFKEMYNPNDYGITLDEIILIKDIMEYLESHKSEISELCNSFMLEYRN